MNTQLSELEKLQVKTKEFLIPKSPKNGEIQAKIQLTALALDEIKLLTPKKGASEEELLESNYKALAKSMGADIESVKKISFSHFEELIENMLEVNGLGDEKKDEKPTRIQRMMDRKNGKSNIKAKE